MESASKLFGSGLTCFFDLVAIEMRNIEAIGLAQQKIAEGLGVLVQRQTEIAQAALHRSFGPPIAAPAATSPVEAAIGRIGTLRTTLVESQANSNILSELALRNGGEVATILQSRMIAALDEFEAALERALSRTAPAATTTPVARAYRLDATA